MLSKLKSLTGATLNTASPLASVLPVTGETRSLVEVATSTFELGSIPEITTCSGYSVL